MYGQQGGVFVICTKCGKTIEDGSVFCNWCGKKQVTQKKKTAKRASGSGAIRKLAGKRARPYQARMPKTLESIGCFKTVAEAEAALAQAIQKQAPDIFTLTLAEVYEDFTSSPYFEGLSETAQKRHITSWKRLAPLYSVKVSQLNTGHFQRIANQMRNEGVKRATLEKYRNLCSLLCKEAMRNGAMATNYGALVQLPEKDSEERTPFTNAQVAQIWGEWQAGDQTAGTIILLCYTGMRPNELKTIERHDGYIITGSKTEKGRDRIIPYPDFVEPILDSMDFSKFDLNNWRRRKFNPLMEKLGIEGCVPYSCRHTYSNIQKRRNIDPEIMMDIMGHEDYATAVENYHHITEDDIERLKSAVVGMEIPQ